MVGKELSYVCVPSLRRESNICSTLANTSSGPSSASTCIKSNNTGCHFELVSSLRYKLACVPIEDSVLPAHPHSRIRVFNGHSMGSQGSKISSDGKLRLIRLCGGTDLF